MGCDISVFVEVCKDGKWVREDKEIFQIYQGLSFDPFGNRSYSVFGFLADVRNYSNCPVIAEPKGFPENSEYLNSPSPYAYERNPLSGEEIPLKERAKVINDCYDGSFGKSWLTLEELLKFDYTKTFENLRYTETIGRSSYGAAIHKKGEGEIITFKEHLGSSFFDDLEKLKEFGTPENVRIVFSFSE